MLVHIQTMREKKIIGNIMARQMCKDDEIMVGHRMIETHYSREMSWSQWQMMVIPRE